MDGTAGGENYGAPGSENQAHQMLAGDLQAGPAIRRDLHNTSRARQGSCNVHVPLGVERQTLRPPQPFIERTHATTRVDFIDPVIRTGDEQVSVRPKGQVVRRDTHLQGRF